MRKLMEIFNKNKSITKIYVVVCEGIDDEIADVLIATHKIEDALDIAYGRQKFHNYDTMYVKEVELL